MSTRLHLLKGGKASPRQLNAYLGVQDAPKAILFSPGKPGKPREGKGPVKFGICAQLKNFLVDREFSNYGKVVVEFQSGVRKHADIEEHNGKVYIVCEGRSVFSAVELVDHAGHTEDEVSTLVQRVKNFQPQGLARFAC